MRLFLRIILILAPSITGIRVAIVLFSVREIRNKKQVNFLRNPVFIKESFLKQACGEMLIEIRRQFHHDLLAISVSGLKCM